VRAVETTAGNRTPSRFALWRCRFLGWHPQRYREPIRFDGASFHMRCTRCGFVGLVDSQGNLF
jgi:hypothetical protein